MLHYKIYTSTPKAPSTFPPATRHFGCLSFSFSMCRNFSMMFWRHILSRLQDVVENHNMLGWSVTYCDIMHMCRHLNAFCSMWPRTLHFVVSTPPTVGNPRSKRLSPLQMFHDKRQSDTISILERHISISVAVQSYPWIPLKNFFTH